MPYFYFDLVVGEEFKDQGGMILEDTQIAFEKADSLASGYAGICIGWRAAEEIGLFTRLNDQCATKRRRVR